MEVTIDIRPEDFKAFVSYLVRPAGGFGGGASIARFVLPLIFGLAAGFLIVSCGHLFGFQMHLPTMALTAALLLLGVVGTARWRQRRVFPVAGGFILGQKQVSVTEDGLREASHGHEALYRWQVVQAICDTRNHIFVLLDRAAGIIVPKRSFVSPQDCESFLAALRQHTGM